MPSFENIKDRKILILSNTMTDWTPEEISTFELSVNQIQTDISKYNIASEIVFVASSNDLKTKLAKFDPNEVVVFNWSEEIDDLKYGFHIAPKILEEMGFIYTGNDSQTLVLTNNKVETKKKIVDHGVSTPKFIVLDETLSNIEGWTTYPCILKPANEHCSFGVTKDSVVDNQEQLVKRAKELFKEFKQQLVVEEFIEGIEFFVSMWGYDKCEVLPYVCIDYSYAKDYHKKIFSYGAKWQRNSLEYKRSTYRLPEELEVQVPKHLEKEVIAAVKAVGGKGYSRVDVRARDGIAYVIDVNPNPDMTRESDFILASSRHGYNYGETILNLCDMAVEYFVSALVRKSKANSL